MLRRIFALLLLLSLISTSACQQKSRQTISEHEQTLEDEED